MQTPPRLSDARALERNRVRALRSSIDYLHGQAAREVQERLNEVNREFTAPAIVTGQPDFWAAHWPTARIVRDTETLDLRPGDHDLVLHVLALHWANDPVGQLVQARRALRPDGLFLGLTFGGRTLHELRACLADAESRLSGGLSPRVVPMGDIRDLGGLLQRAGFAMPVADSGITTATYRDMFHLMRELREMGEASALSSRPRTNARGELFDLANRLYLENFGNESGIPATFELLTLTGWAPADSQPKPLRPGSAKARLAEALGSHEQTAGDKVPGRDD